jgi:hypothetical protein
VDDILDLIKPIQTENGLRHAIYPGNDERVLRVARKIIRGLAHYHELVPFVPDDKVWADVLKYEIPEALASNLIYQHREQDIAEYRFKETNKEGINSAWIIRFFEAPTFVGLVDK